MKTLWFWFLLIAWPAAGQILFQDQTTGWHYDAPSYQATALADYDQDGDIDIFQANLFGSAFLFANLQGHSFSKVIHASGIDPAAPTAAGFWADFNNDRWLDLYVSGYTFGNRLYLNNRSGAFEDWSTSLPPEPLDKMTYTAALADYDLDGYVDIFLVNFTEGNKDQLLHNNGDLTFSDVTDRAGFSQFGNGKSRCACWCDYDNDGDADIFVGGQRQSALFVNQGDGSFAAKSLDIYDTRAAVWADYDQDGDFDLTVCNGGERNPLIFINDGEGGLNETVFFPAFYGASSFYSPLWEDFDNDADLDLILFGNSGSGTGLELLQNDGETGFHPVGHSAGFYSYLDGYSINPADMDNDGRVDLFINDILSRKSYFFHNQSPANHWLQLELTGTASNVSAIGSVVHLFFGSRRQALLLANNGPNSNSPILEFGLGNAPSLDSLAIWWPSGRVQKRYHVLANQRIRITESDSSAGKNVSIESIIAPARTIQSTTTPAMVLRNQGVAAVADLWAQCLIDSSGITCYHCLKHIDQIAAMDTCVVFFPPWTPFTPCSYRTTFTVYLVGDQRPGDNTRSFPVRSVFDNDMSIIKVIAPTAGASLSGRMTPEIEIENAGLQTTGVFETVCEILDVNKTTLYRNAYLTPEMAGMTRRIISFALWTPSGASPFTFRFEIKNTPDQYPANNVTSVNARFKTDVMVDEPKLPDHCLSVNNYPNPFNHRTTIHLIVPISGKVNMKIFSSVGQPVWSWQQDWLEAGEHQLTWDGENDRHQPAASGIYFCHVELRATGGVEQTFTGKMVMLK